jgi:hypothetical protein
MACKSKTLNWFCSVNICRFFNGAFCGEVVCSFVSSVLKSWDFFLLFFGFLATLLSMNLWTETLVAQFYFAFG